MARPVRLFGVPVDLYLEASRAGPKELADTQWQALLATLNTGGREERLLGDILAGKKPLDAYRIDAGTGGEVS